MNCPTEISIVLSVMNTTNTQNKRRYIQLSSEADSNLIKVKLMDNGDWEYDRMGIGKTGRSYFLVDLDDSGEDKRVMNFCKEGLTTCNILIEGVKCNVLEKIEHGYDEHDTHRVNEDATTEEWNEFYKKVLVDEEFHCEIE